MNNTVRYLGLGAMLALTVACSDDDDPVAVVTPEPTPPPAPAADAYLRVVHASPDAPAVNIVANGNTLSAPEGLDYQQATGWLTVPAASYDVSVDAQLPGGGVAEGVIAETLALEGDMTYNVIAVGAVADIAPLVVPNPFSEVTAGNARVQVVHAAPEAPTVDIYVTGPTDDLTGQQPLATAAFTDATGQVEVPAGDYRIRITPTGVDTVVFDSGTVALADGADLLIAATQSFAAGASPVSLLVADGTGFNMILDANSGADLRIVHAAADAPAVDVIANDAVVLADATMFREFVDYQNIPVADYSIDIVADEDNSFVALPDAMVTPTNGAIYTAVANNTLGDLRLQLFEDTPRRLATAAQVRIVHASPTAGSVDIYVTADGNINDVDPAFPAVPFSNPLTETSYVQLAPGEYYVTVTVEGSKDAALETGMLNLQASSIYTAIAVDADGGGLLPQLILMDDF